MSNNDLLQTKMKLAGWKHKRNYFYKRLATGVLVIEKHNDEYWVDLYSYVDLRQLTERSYLKDLDNALTRSLELESIYIEKR